MEPGATFDMSAFGPCPIVHSLCLSNDGTKLLVGVKGCEVRTRVHVHCSQLSFSAREEHEVTSNAKKGEKRPACTEKMLVYGNVRWGGFML